MRNLCGGRCSVLSPVPESQGEMVKNEKDPLNPEI